jgi:uncharacterized protein (TIGR00304 family)
MVDLVQVGLLLVFVGMGVMIASVLAQGRKEGAQVKGGGVVMVGPIPIIFGSDARWASVAIALAILLILLTIVLNLV